MVRGIIFLLLAHYWSATTTLTIPRMHGSELEQRLHAHLLRLILRRIGALRSLAKVVRLIW